MSCSSVRRKRKTGGSKLQTRASQQATSKDSQAAQRRGNAVQQKRHKESRRTKSTASQMQIAHRYANRKNRQSPVQTSSKRCRLQLTVPLRSIFMHIIIEKTGML